MKISIIEYFVHVFSFRNIILELKINFTYWVVYLYMLNIITFSYVAQLLQLQVYINQTIT